jgi:hypothetical protein
VRFGETPRTVAFLGNDAAVVLTRATYFREIFSFEQLDELEVLREVWIVGPSAWQLHDELDDYFAQDDVEGPITNADTDFGRSAEILRECRTSFSEENCDPC